MFKLTRHILLRQRGNVVSTLVGSTGKEDTNPYTTTAITSPYHRSQHLQNANHQPFFKRMYVTTGDEAFDGSPYKFAMNNLSHLSDQDRIVGLSDAYIQFSIAVGNLRNELKVMKLVGNIDLYRFSEDLLVLDKVWTLFATDRAINMQMLTQRLEIDCAILSTKVRKADLKNEDATTKFQNRRIHITEKYGLLANQLNSEFNTQVHELMYFSYIEWENITELVNEYNTLLRNAESQTSDNEQKLRKDRKMLVYITKLMIENANLLSHHLDISMYLERVPDMNTVLKLLENLQKVNIVADAELFEVAIQYIVNSSKNETRDIALRKAGTLFNEMRSLGICPSVDLYLFMINSYIANRKSKVAFFEGKKNTVKSIRFLVRSLMIEAPQHVSRRPVILNNLMNVAMQIQSTDLADEIFSLNQKQIGVSISQKWPYNENYLEILAKSDKKEYNEKCITTLLQHIKAGGHTPNMFDIVARMMNNKKNYGTQAMRLLHAAIKLNVNRSDEFDEHIIGSQQQRQVSDEGSFLRLASLIECVNQGIISIARQGDRKKLSTLAELCIQNKMVKLCLNTLKNANEPDYYGGKIRLRLDDFQRIADSVKHGRQAGTVKADFQSSIVDLLTIMHENDISVDDLDIFLKENAGLFVVSAREKAGKYINGLRRTQRRIPKA